MFITSYKIGEVHFRLLGTNSSHEMIDLLQRVRLVVTTSIMLISHRLADYAEKLLQKAPVGGTPLWNKRACSSEILNLTTKGDHLSVAQAFCDAYRRPIWAWLQQILTPKRDRLKIKKKKKKKENLTSVFLRVILFLRGILNETLVAENIGALPVTP